MQEQSPRGSERQEQDISAKRLGRDVVTALMQEFERRRHTEGTSERQFADEMGIPRTTIQRWRQQGESLAATPAAVAFFESPEGVEFLRRFLVAAHLIMNWMGTCGISLVCLLVDWSGLGPFIAASYGTQQEFSTGCSRRLWSTLARSALGSPRTCLGSGERGRGRGYR